MKKSRFRWIKSLAGQTVDFVNKKAFQGTLLPIQMVQFQIY